MLPTSKGSAMSQTDNGYTPDCGQYFSTPYLTRPIEHGASIVIHSLTKWLGGHGNGIGGVVVDSGTFDWKNGNFPLYDEPDSSYHGLRWGHDLPEPLAPLAFILRMRYRSSSVIWVPVFLLIMPGSSFRGSRPFHLRMERHCENSLAVAKHLQGHDSVEWVRFPWLEGDPMHALNREIP